jgi:hypothetical protein
MQRVWQPPRKHVPAECLPDDDSPDIPAPPAAAPILAAQRRAADPGLERHKDWREGEWNPLPRGLQGAHVQPGQQAQPARMLLCCANTGRVGDPWAASAPVASSLQCWDWSVIAGCGPQLQNATTPWCPCTANGAALLSHHAGAESETEFAEEAEGGAGGDDGAGDDEVRLQPGYAACSAYCGGRDSWVMWLFCAATPGPKDMLCYACSADQQP